MTVCKCTGLRIYAVVAHGNGVGHRVGNGCCRVGVGSFGNAPLQ